MYILQWGKKIESRKSDFSSEKFLSRITRESRRTDFFFFFFKLKLVNLYYGWKMEKNKSMTS